MTQTFFRSATFAQLSRIRAGRLSLTEQGRTRTFGGHTRPDLDAAIEVRSPRLYRRAAVEGALGAAESYLRGEWTTDDLPGALRLFAANMALVDRLDGGAARVATFLPRLAHRLRRNTRLGSRRNIREHYDLGNDFFSLFLDDTMTYSCGVFERHDATLREASLAKLDRVCRKLQLGPRHHVLEIGTGWGSFALYAADRYGCRVTTTTISAAQHQEASRRVRAAGLESRVTVLQRDYRDLRGSFDAVVSIEMVEAVGAAFLDDYFGVCSRVLAPDGQMLLQGIIMPEHRHDAYLRSTDFVQRHVFPGCALPSIGTMARALGRTTDFSIVHVEDLASHYVLTLRLWRQRFLERLDDVRGLGRYDDRFIRLWDYYLAYCEAGFLERCTSVVQMLLAKPGHRRQANQEAGFAALPLAV